MAYKHCCVVDAGGNYKAFVLVRIEPDLATGQDRETPQHYTLQPGERLIETAPPARRAYAGMTGFVRPRWDTDTSQWAEAATAAEIAAWEADHPAPVVPEQPPSNAQLAAENKLLREQIAASADRQEFLEDCIAEMAAQVYNV